MNGKQALEMLTEWRACAQAVLDAGKCGSPGASTSADLFLRRAMRAEDVVALADCVLEVRAWSPPETPPSDAVNHPSHYCSGGLEVFDVIDAFALDFNCGNVIKYVLRAGRKGSKAEDLAKAVVYLQRAVERARKEKANVANGTQRSEA